MTVAGAGWMRAVGMTVAQDRMTGAMGMTWQAPDGWVMGMTGQAPDGWVMGMTGQGPDGWVMANDGDRGARNDPGGFTVWGECSGESCGAERASAHRFWECSMVKEGGVLWRGFS